MEKTEEDDLPRFLNIFVIYTYYSFFKEKWIDAIGFMFSTMTSNPATLNAFSSIDYLLGRFYNFLVTFSYWSLI